MQHHPRDPAHLPRTEVGPRAPAFASGVYYCGWAITGRTTVSHVVTSTGFPIAGSRHRSWCGQTIIVIALTLNARDLSRHCAERNQRLRTMVMTQRVR